jgi:hypothetical protein
VYGLRYFLGCAVPLLIIAGIAWKWPAVGGAFALPCGALLAAPLWEFDMRFSLPICGAMVEFKTKRVNDSLVIDWNTVDLINGYIAYSTSSLGIDVSFSNYLPYTGVKPGLNTLAFK